MMIYEKITSDVLIKVEPSYLEEQSSPEDSHFVWAYRVTIENKSDKTIQLRSRYWRITDDQGHTQEVEGDGVVGEQPVLDPGQSYEYTSGAPLPTPSGFMSGNYLMEGMDGSKFKVDIPAFSLDSPYQRSALH